MSESYLIPNALALNLGVASHLAFFKQGERFLYPFRYVQAFFLAIFVGTFAKSHYLEVPVGLAFRTIANYAAFYLVGLFSSLLIYRIFLNPLNSFPGPYFARISKFDHVLRNGKMDNHHQLYALHKKYGKIVRIGPNDLSVTDADATQVVSAGNSKCYKAPWYEQDFPFISMHTTRDRALHDKRRRVWAPAFSDKALRGYEKRIQKYNDTLTRKLEEFRGEPVNASKWFNLYSFDVMGDLGFGKSFNMLESGETHWAIKLLGEGMDPLAFGLPTWLFRTLVAIPGLSAGYHKFIGFCSDKLDERIKAQGQNENKDIIHTLIEQYNESDNKKDALSFMQGDSRLIIVAGSDTTAAALTFLFYWLCKNPSAQEGIRKEIKEVKINSGGHFDQTELSKCDYLNGCIDEALRLNPPVPSGVFRKTPPEGVNIGKTFIPGDTVIQMPQYAMSRDEDNYADAENFVPERWFSKPEMVKHKDAFGVFSSGPFGCIGKNLAYLEIRTVTSQILQKYNVSFADGEDGTKLQQKTRDHFTLELEDLELCFKER